MADWGIPNPQADSSGGQTTHVQPIPRKVAIPRLPKPELDTKSNFSKETSSKDAKNRVSHACEPCRQRKTKCSGERPVCRHCEDFRISCYYGDGKRDRAKNEMLNLQNKVETYERLLEQLSVQVDESTQQAIQQVIGKKVRPLAKRQDTSSMLAEPQAAGGEYLVGGDAGSIGSNDHVGDEAILPPPNKNVGYLGKSSEVMWLLKTAQGLEDELKEDTGKRADGPDKLHISAITQDDNIFTGGLPLETPTYHMDDMDLSVSTDQVDPYGLPLKEVSDGLLRYYFDTVHPLFPILLRELFMVQYESFYNFPFTPASSKRWLAILNATLAIGAVYSHMLGEETAGDYRDHLLYFTRARMLSLDGGVVYDVADLQQVQVAGLMGMYLLSTSQTNRAWNITGLAIRYGQTLGLHLRTESNNVSKSEKEMRARIWYAIQNLEQILAVSTGRPAAIHQKDCTAPMPEAVNDEVIMYDNENDSSNIPAAAMPVTDENRSDRETSSQSGSGSSGLSTQGSSSMQTPNTPGVRTPPPAVLFYTEYAKLTRITLDTLNTLYCPETMNMSWFGVQGKINDLDKALTQWRSELPATLDFGKRYRDQSLVRQRIALMLQYNHTRIIINRPCLCRMDDRIPNESSRSKQFNRNAAIICLESARGTINMLPEVPNPAGLYATTPWWCLPHFLVSAGIVIIVEIAMQAEHNQSQADAMFADAKRVIDWLHIMGKNNAGAAQAAGTLAKLLAAAAPKIGQIYTFGNLPPVSSPMTGLEGNYVTSRKAETTSRFSQSQYGQGEKINQRENIRALQAVYDQMQPQWSTRNSVDPAEVTSTSMMFPSPQQMHGIDVEEENDSLKRRLSSLLAQQRTSTQPGQSSQWPPPPESISRSPYAPSLADTDEEGIMDNIKASMAQDMHAGGAELESSRRTSRDDPHGSPPGSVAAAAAYHKQIREDMMRRHSQPGGMQPPGTSRKRRESPA